MKAAKGYIHGINGPVVYVAGSGDFAMLQTVRVGKESLLGEVIAVSEDGAKVQVYESTTGLKPGDEVVSLGMPISVELGPGILGNIFDGIERPLKVLRDEDGSFLERGKTVPAIDRDRLWETTILLKPGDEVKTGDIAATVPETSLITHKIMIPSGVCGKVTEVKPSGKYRADDTLLVVEKENGEKTEINMISRWPIRTPRPIQKRNPISKPLITGQRVIDALLPIAKGGTVAVPGGFGTGKTMTQHQIAKWCDADIIIYIGCGERGNEMTQVLEDFSKLIDPKTNCPLLDRTVLIANTSNMPVAAREASIYTGITLAEYYRDMGYDVAIMADSTSRWAEALREISGRLEEMPAEEGFPAYLSSRLSEFYERAGDVVNLNSTEGSVTIIGAVSPQGGDFSEPVTQNTKRFVRCFWALDRQLAYQRHYPAINWLTSYSEYTDDLSEWYTKNVSEKFLSDRREFTKLLQKENALNEIVKLIGKDVLHDDQKLTLEIARIIRLGFLQQNAFHKNDAYVPLSKQFAMMEVILYLMHHAKEVISKQIPISQLYNSGIFDEIIKMKYDTENDDTEKFEEYKQKIKAVCQSIIENQA